MAEFINALEQTITSNSNVLFSDDNVCCGKCIQHRIGSGIVTLRGITNQNNAKFLVNFNGNIAIPTGGTVGEITLAIAIGGETVGYTTMSVTPAAVSEYFNVSSNTYITVPKCDNVTVSIKNTSNQSILAKNVNLIVTRVS